MNALQNNVLRFISLVSLVFVGCSTEPATKPASGSAKAATPAQPFGSAIVSPDVETDENSDSADGDEDEKDEENDKDDDKDEEEADLDLDADKDDADIDTDTDVVGSGSRDLTVRVLNREDGGTILKIRSLGGEWKETLLPDDGHSTTIPGICKATGTTKIEVKVSYEEHIDITFGASLAKLSVEDTKTRIGFETDGGCDGLGCQDDNVFELSCPKSLSVEGA